MLSDTAKLKRDRAIRRVCSKGVIEPLEWIMEYGIHHSSKLNPISTDSEGSLLESVEIDYEAKKYKIIFDDFSSFSTPDETISTGKIKVIIDGITVFHTGFWQNNRRNEWDTPKPYSIQCDPHYPDQVISIRSGDWLKDLPQIVKIEKSARTRADKKRQATYDREKSKQIEDNFD